jgi:hypothetical protein
MDSVTRAGWRLLAPTDLSNRDEDAEGAEELEEAEDAVRRGAERR